jgi:cellulose biosynthesis protein BcsQ
MNSNSRGQIITFYSYKGGTGRSMALSNIACILAERQMLEGGKGVLMMDWDLEAPGLHRYFRNRITTSRLGLERVEGPDASDPKPGLIDLFYELEKRTDYYNQKHKEEQGTNPDAKPISAEQLARSAINDVDLKQYVLNTTVKGLSLIKAGCFEAQNPNRYSELVNQFSWEGIYRKSPHLIRLLAETLAENFAYVLIDSRTGVTDISGICTMILPEKLVVVFTPNLQSLRGGVDLIRRATDYRKESADLRPLVVFPLVSRVEANEPDLRHAWRFGNSELPGYQPEFEKLLAEVYEKGEINFDKYFDEMQIQHIPRYAYGEEIAVLLEKIGDKFSLRRSYQSFASKLIEARAPWEGEINESSSVAASPSGLTTFAASLREILESIIRKPARAAMVVLLVILFAATSALAFYQYRRAQQTDASLTADRAKIDQLTSANALLKQKLEEVQEPLKALEKKDQTIKDLYARLNEVSTARDAASQDALAARNEVALAKTDTARAKSQADVAQKNIAALKDQGQQCNQKYQESQMALKKLQDELIRYKPKATVK